MTSSSGHAQDNFNFIRIVAALMVLASHQAPVTGRREWGFFEYHSLGGFGVLIFFVVSGYLVCQSWMNDPNVIRFVARRLLRIWPGLAAAAIFTILVIGPLFTTLSISDYLFDKVTIHYLVFLKFELAGMLPGVFEQNPIHLINSSLWTIPIELRWYWILMILGVLRVIRFRVLLLLGTLVLAAHYFFFPNIEQYLANGGRRGWKEEFGLFFLAGACLSQFKEVWQLRQPQILILVVTCFLALFAIHRVHAAFWILIPMVVIVFGTNSSPILSGFGRFGDLSYGTYMYAFPVQQAVVAYTSNRLSYGVGLLISLVVTLVLAFCSWHFVEKQALKLKPKREGFQDYFLRKPWKDNDVRP